MYHHLLLLIVPPYNGLYFMLRARVYIPGDTILITSVRNFTDSLDPGSSLVCVTGNVNTHCCRSSDGGNVGEWYFPDGTIIPRKSSARSANFTRSGSSQQVRLNRNNSAIIPNGVYECRVPSMNGSVDIIASITLKGKMEC